ncbi:hypothetical protein QLH52_08500 [Methylomonas sp. OY6]|uniref:Uncharacterized protein n=1 Tax=Methylomonas defluvii TaxID=3045149 RepID=A0ABU4UED9_9GAMM|nr:hypothetical protein [Methylomonas sp. OY6]MDX8127317.1 hypothetical protein [Methylomonas sp. OY6]
MIELLVILGLAVVGWLVWKGKLKLKPIGKTPENKQATPPQPTASRAANSPSQPNTASPTTPIAQEIETPVEPPIQAPEPIAEPAPQAPIVTAVTEEPSTLTKEEPAITIPEDSVLKRHYLAALQAEKEALSNPYPTDSVLRRHYETLHKIASPQHSQAVDESAPSQPEAAAQPASPVEAVRPEDSSVQTQDLEQLRREIAAELPTPPTDSVLKRHYDSLLQTKLQQRLASQ